MNAPKCIGCGVEIDPLTPWCTKCRTPTRGTSCLEKLPRVVDVDALPEWKAPDACCCCLAPSETTEARGATLLTIRLGFTTKVRLRVPLPWCRSCRRVEMKNKLLQVFLTLLAFVVGFPAGAATCVLVLSLLPQGKTLTGFGAMVAFVPGLFVGVLAAVGAGSLYDRYLARKEPGHVISCRGLAIVLPGNDAMHEKKQRLELVFGNRAFAKLWRQLNP